MCKLACLSGEYSDQPVHLLSIIKILILVIAGSTYQVVRFVLPRVNSFINIWAVLAVFVGFSLGG